MRLGERGNGQSPREGVEHLITADAAQIDEIAAPALKKSLPARLANRSKHQVTARFDIECDDNQLPEPGLSKVRQQELGVAAAEIGRGRFFRRRGTAEQMPE